MKIPKPFTKTIAAGGYERIGQYGKYITILSISASTIHLGIDDDPPEEVVAGLQIEAGDHYEQIVLYNAGAVTSTVALYVANTKVTLVDLKNLPAILSELQGQTTFLTVGTEITPAAATATQVLAANSDRTGCVVQAKRTNAANIYIGFDNTVTNTKWVLELKPSLGYTWDSYRGPIYCYSAAGGDKVGYGEW